MSTASKASLYCGVLISSLLMNFVLCSPETFCRQFRRFSTTAVLSRFTNCNRNGCAAPFRTAFVLVPPKIRSQRRNKHLASFIDLSSSPTPAISDTVDISIEYCSACQWMLRSSWLAAELLTTFSKESNLASVALVPKSPPLSPGGIFRVVSKRGTDSEPTVLWDRSTAGRFPEVKEVKQLVRDEVNPKKDLGHSDKMEMKVSVLADKSNSSHADCLECRERERTEMTIKQESLQNEPDTTNQPSFDPKFYANNVISIEFSVGTTISSQENKLHRAVWYANELLNMVYERNAWWKEKQQELRPYIDEKNKSSVPAAVDCVKLIPIRDELDVLNIQLNNDVIFDQSMIDHYGKDLNIRSYVTKILTDGSIGSNVDVEEFKVSPRESQDKKEAIVEMMSDEDADKARKFFGVF